MTRVFWDTNVFVYLLEGGTFSARVKDIRSRMLDRGDQLVTSALTLGELLVKPRERGIGGSRSRSHDSTDCHDPCVRCVVCVALCGDPFRPRHQGTRRDTTCVCRRGRRRSLHHQRRSPVEKTCAGREVHHVTRAGVSVVHTRTRPVLSSRAGRADPPPLPGPKDPAYINYSEIENALSRGAHWVQSFVAMRYNRFEVVSQSASPISDGSE